MSVKIMESCSRPETLSYRHNLCSTNLAYNLMNISLTLISYFTFEWRPFGCFGYKKRSEVLYKTFVDRKHCTKCNFNLVMKSTWIIKSSGQKTGERGSGAPTKWRHVARIVTLAANNIIGEKIFVRKLIY